jgi:hypothetical protein
MGQVTVMATLDEKGELHLSEAARQRLRKLSAGEVSLAIEPLDDLGRRVDEIQRWLRSAQVEPQPLIRLSLVNRSARALMALWESLPRSPQAQHRDEVIVLLRDVLHLNPAESLTEVQFQALSEVVGTLRSSDLDDDTVDEVLSGLERVELRTLPDLHINDGSLRADELI